MYQTIDEADEVEAGELRRRGSSRWILASMAVAFATLAFITFMSMPSGPSERTDATDMDTREIYLAALSEPSPALRRARLADFAQTYPDDPRSGAVRAQLSVLNAREASDWAEVTDVLYDRSLGNLDRLAELDSYEAKWGANLLGGRADEIARLREDLQKEAASAPSRALETTDSPIPESIQGQAMAGGPSLTPLPAPPIVQPRPLPTPPPAPPRIEEVDPELRRAPSPSYPSAARRRGIGAVVELEMDIDDRGRVRDVRILRVDAERYGKDFARAAERAASRSRFSPRELDGQPVPTTGIRKRYRFEP